MTGRTPRADDGSVSLELVLMVPVLVLLTLFVLWAGRGGRVALSADLAASEAATAAALCCEEGEAGALDREAVVHDMLESRTGLAHLCVGGVRPVASPSGGDSSSGSDEGFVREQWLEFEPGRRTAGVGVLDVRFECETDGAVAPLRGLFPTVRFEGQATEVVLRNPRPSGIGFESTRFRAREPSSWRSTQLEFTVVSDLAFHEDVVVLYWIDEDAGTATAGDDYRREINGYDPQTREGSVLIPAGRREATIAVHLLRDGWHEGTETLELSLIGLVDPDTLSPFPDGPDRPALGDLLAATGEIIDDDPEPHLFVSAVGGPCRAVEGDSVTLSVRLRDAGDTRAAPSATPARVSVSTERSPHPDTGLSASAGSDYTWVHRTLTFAPGEHAKTVTVEILDDESDPVGEGREQFAVRLWGERGARLGQDPAEAACEIIDDETIATVRNARALEGEPVTFVVQLRPAPSTDIELEYRLDDYLLTRHPAQRGAAADCVGDDDYLALSGVLRIPAGRRSARLPPVATCGDSAAEPDEQFWLVVSRRSGEVYVPPGGGAVGTILDDDAPDDTGG